MIPRCERGQGLTAFSVGFFCVIACGDTVRILFLGTRALTYVQISLFCAPVNALGALFVYDCHKISSHECHGELSKYYYLKTFFVHDNDFFLLFSSFGASMDSNYRDFTYENIE